MADETNNPNASVIPTLRYADARAAIKWLCNAFGFEDRLVVPGDDGPVVHAQLVFGNGMVMLSSARDGDFDALQKPPGKLGGAVSQSPYIIEQDIDNHYARAVAAGAEIVLEITDQDYGGRGYSCRDPEGHSHRLLLASPCAAPEGRATHSARLWPEYSYLTGLPR